MTDSRIIATGNTPSLGPHFCHEDGSTSPAARDALVAYFLTTKECRDVTRGEP